MMGGGSVGTDIWARNGFGAGLLSYREYGTWQMCMNIGLNSLESCFILCSAAL